MKEKAEVLISTKSWHYKLMKLVLGKMAPTPKDMHNLCPYFWLLIFCLLTSIFVIPVKYTFIGLGNLIDFLGTFIDDKLVEPTAKKWYNNLSDLEVFAIYCQYENITKLYSNAFGHTYYSRQDFVKQWWKKKYGIDPSKEGSADFNEWVEKNKKEWNELNYKPKEPSKFSQNMETFRDNIDYLADNLGSTIMSWKILIKWTKRVVGLIITGIGLVITYFITSILGRGFLYLIEHWDWSVVMYSGLTIVGIAVLVGLIYIIGLWVKVIQTRGLKLWYVKLVYWPVYVLIYIPFKFLFYTFLWEIIIVNLGYLLKAGAKIVWGSLLGFLGIFGEYMGASYTDYCPGLKWKEENEEDN